MPKLFVVGDSTVAEFNDISYFYPRYGYGAVLDFYFDIEIINLAISGRSSKSFTVEKNYQYLFDNLSSGDYVLIGFGHNDEKFDDSFRFTDASLPLDNDKSFKHVLYYSYVKRTIDKGATPILTTPIIRLSEDNIYEGEVIHDTPYGDYRKAIIELCEEFNLLCVDLTGKSLDYAKNRKFEDLIIYHAVTRGKMDNNILTYDEKSVDKTHLSYLGALFSAYFIASYIKNSNLELKKYLKDIKYPTDDLLKMNPEYKYIPYFTPNIEEYKPTDNYMNSEYVGCAFGSLDNINGGYVAKRSENGYIVGQSGEKTCGRINASTEGYAFLFKRISRSDNFIFEANAKIVETKEIRQSGFGLMLRGDSYLNQKENNVSIVTNYIASGLITTDKVTYAIFNRKTTTDLNRDIPVGEFFYKKDDTAKFRIERVGQVVKVRVEYLNKIYEETYTDYDYYKDNDYLFVGMFSTNGTLVEFTDLSFMITGKAIEA